MPKRLVQPGAGESGEVLDLPLQEEAETADILHGETEWLRGSPSARVELDQFQYGQSGAGREARSDSQEWCAQFSLRLSRSTRLEAINRFGVCCASRH